MTFMINVDAVETTNRAFPTPLATAISYWFLWVKASMHGLLRVGCQMP